MLSPELTARRQPGKACELPGLPSRVIVCLSQGRSGTRYLSRVMSLFPRMASLHEPQPDFTQQSASAQVDTSIADDFLRAQKLPAIGQYASFETYCETSHMWCFGLAQSWLRLNLSPRLDAIILDRDLRLIATSIHRLGITPGKDPWILDPLASGCLLTHDSTESWGNYHRCYAYCLEVEARKAWLSQRLTEAGGRITRISLPKLSTWKGLLQLRRDLGLPFPRPRQLYAFLFLQRIQINAKTAVKDDLGIPAPDKEYMARCEAEVKDAMRPAKESPAW